MQAIQEELQAATEYMSKDGTAALHAVEKWKEVEKAVERLHERMNSLPDSFAMAVASLQASYPEIRRLLPNTASAMCSRLHAIFLRPPPVIELPLSAHAAKQDVGNDDAFADFQLVRGISAKAEEAEHTFDMYVYAEHDIVSTNILGTNSWEPELTKAVLSQLYQFAKDNALKSKDVYFIDIGSNLGIYSLSAAAHGFQVIAFEPMFSNQLAHRLSTCANPGMHRRVTIINKGLGKLQANCTLHSDVNNVGDGAMLCGYSDAIPSQAAEIKERDRVDVARLDDELRDLFPLLKGKIGVVKMDCEGHEPAVVEGGLDFFREVAPHFVVAECDDGMMQAATGGPAAPLFTKMSELGYQLFNAQHQEISTEAFEGYKCGATATIYFKLKH